MSGWRTPGPDGQMNPIYGDHWLNAIQLGLSVDTLIERFEGTPKPTADEIAREVGRAVRRHYTIH